MAASPRFKIYDSEGNYVAAAKHADTAAAVVAIFGDGAKVKVNHSRIVWHEGHEDFPADESWDRCAGVIYERDRH